MTKRNATPRPQPHWSDFNPTVSEEVRRLEDALTVSMAMAMKPQPSYIDPTSCTSHTDIAHTARNGVSFMRCSHCGRIARNPRISQ